MKQFVAPLGVLAWIMVACQSTAIGQVTFSSLLQQITDRDDLSYFPSYDDYDASSYDRAENVGPSTTNWGAWYGNKDYTNYYGTYNGQKVMLSTTGAGALTQLWTTDYNANGIINIYIDGSTTPISILSGGANSVIGANPIFGSSLSLQNPDYTNCPANNLYAPIPYQNSVIVTYTGASNQWYNINYQKYAPGTAVTSFTSTTATTTANAAAITNANQWLSNPASAPRNTTGLQTQTKGGSLASGQYLEELFAGSGSGAVRQLQVTLNAANMSAALQNTYLQISCDNQRTVYVPVGMFFGTGPQQINNNTSDYYTTVNGATGGTIGTMTSYWTMPYQNATDIRLVNLGSQAVTATLTANSSQYAWSSQSMYFHADNRAENNITAGGYNGGVWNGGQNQDWNYARIQGQGVYVGDTLVVTNTGGVAGQWWGEGDDKMWVDSSPASSPQGLPRILGTGTEDAYSGANGFPTVYSSPFSNAAQVNASNGGLGTTVVTRLRSQDAVPFNSSLQRDQEIQSWANQSLNYQATSFWYGTPGAYAWQTIANVSNGVNSAISGGTSTDAGTWQFLGSKSVLVNTSSGQGTAWNYLSPITVGNSGSTGLGSSGNGGYNFPAIGNAPILTSGAFVRNDDVSMYPGGTYNGGTSAYTYAVDRWLDTTTSGTIDINGSIRNLQTNSSGVDFFVVVNGVIKYSVSGAGELPQSFFDVQTIVQPGSIVDFVLGAANSGALTGLESELDATISIPEGIGAGMGVPALTTYNSIASGSWGSTSIWDIAAVPGSLTIAQVNANLVTVNSAATAWSCAVASGGTLALAASKTLTVSTTATVSPGGVLSFASGSTLIASGGQLDKVVASGSFAINTAGSISINTYTGNGTLTFAKQGEGDLTLAPFTSNSALSTTFQIMAGRLLVSGSNPLGGATSVLLPNGALNSQGGATPNPASALLTFSGTGSAAPVLESSGTLNAAIGASVGNIQWTGNGGFSAQGGPLVVRLNGGAGTIAWGSANFVPSGSNLVLGSAASDNVVDFQNGINLSGGNRTIVAMENPSSTVALAIVSGAIIGSGGLTSAGSGTLSLSGSDTYTGATLVTAGTLNVAAAGALTATGTVSAYSGGVLTISGSVNVASNGAFAIGTSYTGTGTVNVESGAVLNIGGGSGGKAGRIYIGGKLDNVGSAGAGVFNINGGIVHVAAGSSSAVAGDANALWMNAYSGAGATLNLNGGTLSTAREIENGSAASATVNFNGGALQAAANLSPIIGSNNSTAITANINLGGAIIDTQGYSVAINQALAHGQGSPDGGLTKTGSGTLILGGANTYTGTTTINAGIVQVNNASALGNGGNITFSGGTLQYTATSANQDWSAFFKNSTVAAIKLDTNSQTVTFNQSIDSSNTAGLSKIGAGTLLLTAAQTYSGPTLITGGVLRLQSTGIGYVGTQFDMGGAGGNGPASHWRQSSTPKTYALENNNIYGTDGYDVVGASSRVLVPGYVSGFTLTSSTYPGNASYATIDDPNSPSSSIVSGTTNPGSANVFTFTTTGSNIPGDIRLGLMIDGLDIAGYNPASLQIRQLNGTQSTSTVVATTLSQYNDSQPDWVFFDIKGAKAGNQYSVYAQQGANGTATVQVFTFDSGSIGASSILPMATALSVAAGAKLDLGGVSQQVASLSDSNLTGGGSVVNSNTGDASVLILSPTGGSTTFSGQIGGVGGQIGLIVNGSGMQVLAGSDNYTGGTTVSSGTLVLQSAASLLAGSSLTIGGGSGPSAVFTSPQSAAVHAASDNLAPVPEPGTLALLAVGTLCALVGCRKHHRMIGLSGSN